MEKNIVEKFKEEAKKIDFESSCVEVIINYKWANGEESQIDTIAHNKSEFMNMGYACYVNTTFDSASATVILKIYKRLL